MAYYYKNKKPQRIFVAVFLMLIVVSLLFSNHFLIEVYDLIDYIVGFKVLVIDEVYIAYHTEVFDGNYGESVLL